MRGDASGDADRRQLGQHRGGALDGWNTAAAWPDVDDDALRAIVAGTQEVVGGPALPRGGEVVGPAAQVAPRTLWVADHVGKAPQPLGGKAQLGAQQILARPPGVLLPLLLGQEVEARGGRGVRRSIAINRVGKQAELAWLVLEERISTGPGASDGGLPQQWNGAGHCVSQLLMGDAALALRHPPCRACKREGEGRRSRGHVKLFPRGSFPALKAGQCNQRIT